MSCDFECRSESAWTVSFFECSVYVVLVVESSVKVDSKVLTDCCGLITKFPDFIGVLSGDFLCEYDHFCFFVI